MPKKLTEAETKKRLQQLRNVTMLHSRALARVAKLEALLQARDEIIISKDLRISELETALLDKEVQRKELASKLFKAKKDRSKAVTAVTKDLGTGSGASPRLPGAQPGHRASHRPVPDPEMVTDRRIFDLSVCPACKNHVGDIVDKVEKYQEDIDLAPRNKIVRHYTITRHWCGHCQEYIRPVHTPAQVLRRFGPNLVGYILYARYRLRLPLRKIQESLRDLHDFVISEGEIQRQLDDARVAFGDQYDLIAELIRSARVVYADESGWRMDGYNWYIWAFVVPSTGAIRYEIADTRGGGIAAGALGVKADRVIVSDGYAVYDKLPGSNQQCWVHLLRVAKAKSKAVYRDLCTVYAQLLPILGVPATARTTEDKQNIVTSLAAIRDREYNKNKRTGRAFRDPPEPLAEEVQARLKRNFDQLLVCLDHDGVLPENNTAERAIRPQVILRKIFGGSRSPDGAATHVVNTSVISTAMNQHPRNTFFESLLPLIQETHTKPKRSRKPTRQTSPSG